MKAIGIILTVLIWVYIVITPYLYTIDCSAKPLVGFVLGITQSVTALYVSIEFYKWFKSNIK